NITEKIGISFSACDFGFINWSRNAQVASAKGDYTFEGVNVSLMQDEEGNTTLGIDGNGYNVSNLVDTALNAFHMRVVDKNYTTWLPSNVYVGATYQLHPKIGFGFLYHGEIYKKSFMQQFTLSANSNLTHWLSLHASWSLINNTVGNVGFGFSIRGAIFTWYAVTDNVLSMIWPQKAKTMNIRMGCNLTFGHPKKVSKVANKL
ncbi:MAG: hypothetical protein HUK15_08525, partial [Bacteroidales bacterium]|nr:hypothetical protein [Bacteroidales bacterium]